MIKQYLYIGIAAVALLGAGTIIYQHRVINALEADNAALLSQVKSKDGLIQAQSDAAAEMQRVADETTTIIRLAGARVTELQTALAAERAKRTAKVETDYALPNCLALLSMDLASVCPAHAQRLRDNAAVR